MTDPYDVPMPPDPAPQPDTRLLALTRQAERAATDLYQIRRQLLEIELIADQQGWRNLYDAARRAAIHARNLQEYTEVHLID